MLESPSQHLRPGQAQLSWGRLDCGVLQLVLAQTWLEVVGGPFLVLDDTVEHLVLSSIKEQQGDCECLYLLQCRHRGVLLMRRPHVECVGQTLKNSRRTKKLDSEAAVSFTDGHPSYLAKDAFLTYAFYILQSNIDPVFQ